MVHTFKAITILRGTTVEFVFEDGSKFVKTFDVKRNHLTNAKMQKNKTVWKLSTGVTYRASDLYAEMMEVPA